MSFADFRSFACKCGNLWFDYYCQAYDRIGVSHIVERIPACIPPYKPEWMYGSSNADTPYSRSNPEGAFSFECSMSVPTGIGGDWAWYFVGSFHQLYKFNLSGTIDARHSTTYPALPDYNDKPFEAPADFARLTLRSPSYFVSILNNHIGFGNFDPFYPPSVARQQVRPNCGPAPQVHYIYTSLDDRVYNIVGEGGGNDTKTYTKATFLNAANRADNGAKLVYVSPRTHPYCAGVVLTTAFYQGEAQFRFEIWTGTQKDEPRYEINKTNQIAVFAEEKAMSEANYNDLYDDFYKVGVIAWRSHPTYWYTVGFYDRNDNGDEIVQIIRYEVVRETFGLSAVNYVQNFVEELWYVNGTLFMFYEFTPYTPFSNVPILGHGQIASAIAVDPDPDLETDTKFVVVRRSTEEGAWYVQGLDAAGNQTWIKRQVDYGVPIIRCASDRYVYVRGLVLDPSTETSTEVGLSRGEVTDWMLRLDGGLAWPHVSHELDLQLQRRLPDQLLPDRGVVYYDCYKDSSLPLTADIDLLEQWRSSYK